jgi:hypothetical protein
VPHRSRSALFLRLIATIVGTVTLALLPSAYAAAAPPPAGTVGPATPGTAVCTIDGLPEITGMVATAQGIYVVQGGHTRRPATVVVWTVNATTCKTTSTDYGFLPIDPQDLSLGSDGSLWVADIGQGVGPQNTRTRIALERVTVGSGQAAVPYRALYPASGKFQAEAMLLDGTDKPVIIAQESGHSVLYSPAQPLTANAENGLPALVKVGEFVTVATGTANPLGDAGQSLVTGAARSPDGSKVVIRTASDAYEFAVGADGDIVKAITTGSPLITPLPNEERGTAITYSADGSQFLTLSTAPRPVLRSYRPFRPQPPSPAAPSGAAATAAAAPKSTSSSSNATPFAIAAVVVVVAALLVFGWLRLRRRVVAGQPGVVADWQPAAQAIVDRTPAAPDTPRVGRHSYEFLGLAPAQHGPEHDAQPAPEAPPPAFPSHVATGRLSFVDGDTGYIGQPRGEGPGDRGGAVVGEDLAAAVRPEYRVETHRGDAVGEVWTQRQRRDLLTAAPPPTAGDPDPTRPQSTGRDRPAVLRGGEDEYADRTARRHDREHPGQPAHTALRGHRDDVGPEGEHADRASGGEQPSA